ncbi:MAG: DUF3014 domain-containing protein, partial [Betaproteobacteria bacterium]
MEQFSAGERPYVRPERSTYVWAATAVVALLVAGGGYYWYTAMRTPEAPAPAASAPQAAAKPIASAEKPALRLPEPAAPPKPLPTLENSDSMMRESLAGLLGRKGFDDFVVPTELVRRIVATVDNLPRQTAPRRMLPLNPVPGVLGTAPAAPAGEFTLDAANAARYTPYVRVMEAVNPNALVYSYVQAYPLFQRAYEQLGYPGKYFNDRLLEAIDDLLAAPETTGPVRLLRPKVLYEFVDPDLETRSAGQKIMLRMGAENAAKVKAKLR